MRSLLVIFAGLSVALAACTALPGSAGPATPGPADPVTIPSPAPTPRELTAAQKAAVAQLAQAAGLQPDQIRVDSTEAVTWPDGCLGVQRLGVMCTQALVPGYRIVLEAGGKQYEYHTNLDGSIIVPANAPLQGAGPAQDAVIKQLANNLGIPVSDVQLVSSSGVEWPDSCLGVALDQVMCAQVVTPGYLIVLQAGDRQYEYHTNEDASSIMPATLALDWKQQGGIAGLCQSITVFLSGEMYGMDCKGTGGGTMRVLTAEQRQKLYSWIDTLGTTTIDLSDPQGVADRMTRTADLLGRGTKAASEADKHEIFNFGQSLYRELYR